MPNPSKSINRAHQRSSRRSGKLYSLDWIDLQRCATGTAEDHFENHRNSIRAKCRDNEFQKDFDPVRSLKDGVMVLSFDKNFDVFDRRLLKVDDELHFMYIMDLDPGHIKAVCSHRHLRQTAEYQSHLQTIPLAMIRHIYVMDEALYICEKNGISLHGLGLETTFVIWVDVHATKIGDETPSLDEHIPPIDQIVILVVSPNAHVAECIRACQDVVEGALDPDLIENGRLRMKQAQLQDIEDLLLMESDQYNFDMSFEGSRFPRTVSVNTADFDHPDMGGLLKKLEVDLLGVDFARMSFLLQEAAGLRTAAEGIGMKIFRRGVGAFINDYQHIKLPVSDDDIGEAVASCTTLIRTMNMSEKVEAHHYTEASGRSWVAALQSLFALERDYTTLVNSDSGNAALGHEFEGDNWKKVDGGAIGELPGLSWRCSSCRFINEAGKDACDVCGAANDATHQEIESGYRQNEDPEVLDGGDTEEACEEEMQTYVEDVTSQKVGLLEPPEQTTNSFANLKQDVPEFTEDEQGLFVSLLVQPQLQPSQSVAEYDGVRSDGARRQIPTPRIHLQMAKQRESQFCGAARRPEDQQNNDKRGAFNLTGCSGASRCNQQ